MNTKACENDLARMRTDRSTILPEAMEVLSNRSQQPATEKAYYCKLNINHKTRDNA